MNRQRPAWVVPAWMTVLSALLPMAAVGGGVAVYVHGHELVAGEIGGAIVGLDELRPQEAPDYEDLQPGDLCSIADAPPAKVPSAFWLDIAHDGGEPVDVLAARALVEAAFPMIHWRVDGQVINVVVVDANLHFEGDDIAGVACGMDILIEAQYLLTSTLPHEVGHVLGLEHADGSYMQIGRDPDQAEDWEGWTLEQEVHLLGFQAGADWPAPIE